MHWVKPHRTHDTVYSVDSRENAPSWPLPYTSELKRLYALTRDDLTNVRKLQGSFSATYLRLVYRSPHTHVLLIRDGSRVAGILWAVPGRVVRKRYPFVPNNAFAIISCATAVEHRGQGLYPNGIRTLAASGLAAKYFIWAHDTNLPSLRGIEKAGGSVVGHFIRKRWFRGLIAKVEYRKRNES